MLHRVDRSPVSIDLVAKSSNEGRRNSGALGHAGNLEAEDALDEEVGCDGDRAL